jgi:hypothetical protein
VVKHIETFKMFEYRDNKSKLNHFLPVNFQPMRKLKQETDVTLFNIFPDTQDLYVAKDREQYSFTLYTKIKNSLLYWGSCDHGPVDSYDCFRTIGFYLVLSVILSRKVIR